MKVSNILKVIMVLGVAGMILSGYLSWYNLWGPGCSETIIKCGGSNPILIFGLPTCVYGFFMYLIVVVLAILGLIKENKKPFLKTLLVFAVIGVGFSGFLSYYEIFAQDTELTSLPACVYGLILYISILIFVVIGLKKPTDQSSDG